MTDVNSGVPTTLAVLDRPDSRTQVYTYRLNTEYKAVPMPRVHTALDANSWAYLKDSVVGRNNVIEVSCLGTAIASINSLVEGRHLAVGSMSVL